MTGAFPPGTAGRRERALERCAALGAECLLACDPATVTWLTGFAEPYQLGPDAYGLAPMAVITRDEPPALVLSAGELASADTLGCTVMPAGGQTNAPFERGLEAADAVARLVGDRRVATELAHCPALVASRLRTVEATSALAHLRAIKDDDEIALIRELVAIADAGQSAARSALRAGVTELELWHAAQAAMESRVAGRLTVVGDLLSGSRTAMVAGDPTGRRVLAGEPVICDLLPRHRGYWGDSTSTPCVEPNARVATAHAKVLEVLERLVGAVRPGVRAGDLDEIARHPLGFPHHTGHGVGTSYHEAPRIVPGSDERLEAGMVVALEPATYTDDFGIRLEVVVLVTESGGETLSAHDIGLE